MHACTTTSSQLKSYIWMNGWKSSHRRRNFVWGLIQFFVVVIICACTCVAVLYSNCDGMLSYALGISSCHLNGFFEFNYFFLCCSLQSFVLFVEMRARSRERAFMLQWLVICVLMMMLLMLQRLGCIAEVYSCFACSMIHNRESFATNVHIYLQFIYIQSWYVSACQQRFIWV